MATTAKDWSHRGVSRMAFEFIGLRKVHHCWSWAGYMRGWVRLSHVHGPCHCCDPDIGGSL